MKEAFVTDPCLEIVTLDKFAFFVDWFGPLKKIIGGCNIIDRVSLLCEKEYFHGNITRVEAEQKLAKGKKGDFLVRLSATEPEKSPYTISKVNRQGVINHQRVYVRPEKDGYYVSIKVDNKVKKLEASGMISDLIRKHARDLYLKRDIGGSMFSSIFQKEDKFGGYLQDDDDL